MPDNWAEYWPYIVAVASVLIGVPAIIHVAMTKDDVRAAIGWVGIVILSPFVGVGLYLVAGINRIRRSSIGLRRLRAEESLPAVRSKADEFVPDTPRLSSLKRLGDNVSPFRLEPGNHVLRLDGGNATYGAMVQAIEAAQRHVVLSTYIFDNDAAGRRVVDALSAARARGVEVRVLVDAVGARYSRPSIIGPLREGSIPVDLFLGGIIGFRLPYANLRNHRKILVVDGWTGFTGGMNIRSQFAAEHASGAPDRDTHFKLEGPVVAQLLAVFVEDWYFTTGELLEGATWQAPSPTADPSGIWARAILSGPDMKVASTHTMVMGALAVSRERVRICSPYFLPDLPLINALAVTARRGVEVDIVVPSVNNLRLVDFAMTAQFDQLVSAGCRIWRSSGTFDHSKLMTVDSRWALVGSSNMDPRSHRLNFEIDIEAFDEAMVADIDREIESRIAGASAETLQRLRARPFLKRLRNRIVWLASPYL
jgi:cardiolipin synthase A/B